MSELVLEFPNLSWKHLDASESDIREEERDERFPFSHISLDMIGVTAPLKVGSGSWKLG